MKRKNNQAGFTLIELMIVIAIIGILMAYAIPAYRDYTVRSKAGECNSIIAAAKLAVAEYRINKGAWAANNADAQIDVAANISGANVASVTVNGDAIDCLYNANDATLNGQTLTWTAADNGGSVSWTCGVTGLTPAQDPCP